MKPEFLDCSVAKIHNHLDGFSFVPVRTERIWYFFPDTIWKFTLNKEKPLTLELRNGMFVQPNYSFETNMGSIPPPFRLWFPKDEFPVPYALHDDEYNRKGIYVASSLEGPFEYVRSDREGADVRLVRNIHAFSPKVNPNHVAKIYSAVRIGGSGPWKRGRVRESFKRGRIYVQVCST